VANPESIKNINDFVSISVIILSEPTKNTIIHENNSTTVVRSAVAVSESVFMIPHFAKTDVSPAEKADNIAIIIHISLSLIFTTIKINDIS